MDSARIITEGEYKEIARLAVKSAWEGYFRAALQLKEVYFSPGSIEVPKPQVPQELAVGLEKFHVRLVHPLEGGQYPLQYREPERGSRWQVMSMRYHDNPLPNWFIDHWLKVAPSPQAMWRLVSLVEQARLWCLEAIEEVKRAREELLRQQAEAVKELEAYVTSRIL